MGSPPVKGILRSFLDLCRRQMPAASPAPSSDAPSPLPPPAAAKFTASVNPPVIQPSSSSSTRTTSTPTSVTPQRARRRPERNVVIPRQILEGELGVPLNGGRVHSIGSAKYVCQEVASPTKKRRTSDSVRTKAARRPLDVSKTSLDFSSNEVSIPSEFFVVGNVDKEQETAPPGMGDKVHGFDKLSSTDDANGFADMDIDEEGVVAASQAESDAGLPPLIISLSPSPTLMKEDLLVAAELPEPTTPEDQSSTAEASAHCAGPSATVPPRVPPSRVPQLASSVDGGCRTVAGQTVRDVKQKSVQVNILQPAEYPGSLADNPWLQGDISEVLSWKRSPDNPDGKPLFLVRMSEATHLIVVPLEFFDWNEKHKRKLAQFLQKKIAAIF